MTGSVPHVTLTTDRSPDQAEYRAHIARLMHTLDNSVRGPFLGHLTQLLFEVFDKNEPVLKALLLLANPLNRVWLGTVSIWK